MKKVDICKTSVSTERIFIRINAIPQKLGAAAGPRAVILVNNGRVCFVWTSMAAEWVQGASHGCCCYCHPDSLCDQELEIIARLGDIGTARLDKISRVFVAAARRFHPGNLP